MRLCCLVAGMLLATAIGCSGSAFVPVSGVVTLDGKPYGKAAVSFQPIGDKANPYPGRGSSAYTNEDGRFELISDSNKGAVVGKHLVRITTRAAELVGEPGVGSPDGSPSIRPVDPIPSEWKVEFDVPSGGTDKANFDITSRKK